MSCPASLPRFPGQRSWPQVEAEFLAWRSPLPNTRKTYASVLRLFGLWLADRPGPAFAGSAWAYVLELTHLGRSAATVALHLSVLRQVGLFLGEPLPEGPALPRPEKLIYQRAPLSKRSARALVAEPGPDTPAKLRRQAVIALMLRAGLRSCEVARARIRDLQVQSDVPVLWVQGKGKLTPDAFVVLNQKAQEALHAYLASRGNPAGEEALITALDDPSGGPLSERQLQRIVTGALEEAGLKRARVSTHSLRHTAASLAVGAGAPLPAVQAMMRHADPRTTARYVHLRSRLRRPAENTLDF